MRKCTVMHGIEIQDNENKLMKKLTVQAVLTESRKGSDEEIRKIQESLIDMVTDYMNGIE
ncbi:MAG: hypothetical protein K2O91_10795 [Lachnospiraceae bacterium]|nr:hypothetical protein [Lachnospiraceae bacterium]